MAYRREYKTKAMVFLKKMEESRFYELFSVIQLGLGTMMMFTGFDTHTFVLESVVHSIFGKDPTKIDIYAGYYGQAALYVAYALSNLITPLLIQYTHPKWGIFLGSLFFTLYQAGFLQFNNHYFYISSVLTGFGFALFYTGHGCYLAEHSTRKRMARNAAVSWGVTCLSYTAGGIIFLFALKSTTSNVSSGRHEFDESQVRNIFGLYTIFAFFCNLTFLLLPTAKVKYSICDDGGKPAETKRIQSLVATFKAFGSSKIWLLSTSWLNLGVTSSFMLGVYPTALLFTGSLQSSTTSIAYYALAITVGELTIAFIISFFSHRNHDFGRVPAMLIGFVIHTIVCVLILLSTPRYSPLRPNDDETLLLKPNFYIALICGFLLGVGDGCRQTARSCLIPILLPKCRAQGFSISKIFQSLGSFTLFFFSPVIDLYMHFALAMVVNLVGTITYIIASLRHDRVKQSIRKSGVFMTNNNEEFIGDSS